MVPPTRALGALKMLQRLVFNFLVHFAEKVVPMEKYIQAIQLR
jgi:hypothetical protein